MGHDTGSLREDRARTHPRAGRARRAFSALASRAAAVAGSPWAFGVAAALVALWALSGPVFGFSDTWQLAINTTTTIVTFLMVFLLQTSQNKDTLVLQVKLNELIAAVEGASNRLIDIEDLSEDDVRALHERYERLAARYARHGDSRESVGQGSRTA